MMNFAIYQGFRFAKDFDSPRISSVISNLDCDFRCDFDFICDLDCDFRCDLYCDFRCDLDCDFRCDSPAGCDFRCDVHFRL